MVRASSDSRSGSREIVLEAGEHSHGDQLPPHVAEPGEKFEEWVETSRGADEHELTEQDMAESLLDQIREALGDMTGNLQATPGEEHSADSLHDRPRDGKFASARTHIRPSKQAFRQSVTESPWPWLLAAAAAGYSLAWMLYARNGRRSVRVPGKNTRHLV